MGNRTDWLGIDLVNGLRRVGNGIYHLIDERDKERAEHEKEACSFFIVSFDFIDDIL